MLFFLCVYDSVLHMSIGHVEFWFIMCLSIEPLVLLLEKPKNVSHCCVCVLLRSWIVPQWEVKVKDWKSLQMFSVTALDNILCSSYLEMTVQLPSVWTFQGSQLMFFRHVSDKWNPFGVASLLHHRAVSWKQNRSEYHGNRTGLSIT